MKHLDELRRVVAAFLEEHPPELPYPRTSADWLARLCVHSAVIGLASAIRQFDERTKENKR